MLVSSQLLQVYVHGRLSVDVGLLIKQHLLRGALNLSPDQVRDQGAGQLLGRVFEAEAVEFLALQGGFLGLVAVIELLFGMIVLGAGMAGSLQQLLLGAWTALGSLLCVSYYRQRRRWTEARLAMTHDLVERMIGHRTRLAQESETSWHHEEDQSLGEYLRASQRMDRCWLRLAAIPRGWMVVGLLGLTPTFMSAQTSPEALAVSLGGVLLAFRAMNKLVSGLGAISGAAIAGEQVAPLARAADESGEIGLPWLRSEAQAHAEPGVVEPPLLEAHDLSFRYHASGNAVLQGCQLTVRRGDRLLLEGNSGSGKSTLVSTLTGLQRPERGLLLLHGIDHRVLGWQGWGRHVASAPQFHENHVFSETLAFNLLMGRRRWPPSTADLEEAEAVCRELGLGELLDRMPAGVQQLVGETGWQLSHGERSRLYIARVLLQRPELIVLDESFAALDPETLRQTMRCVLARVPTMMVVAHP
jgi:ATP-binding cassette subfamily B protein